MAEPDTLPFAAIRGDLERLERAMSTKAAVDASFAWLADLHSAGRLVGSTRTVDYLTDGLGVSRGEAFSRLRQAEDLYAPPVEPTPDPGEDETDNGEARREAERRRERERRAQEEARRKSASAEKRRIIERELTHLSKHAVPGRLELLSQSLSEAERRDVQDLRAWVREQVRRANAAATQPDGKKDPFAALRKRRLRLSRPDADGGVRIDGYLPADMAALVRAAVNPRSGTSSVDDEDDKRTIDQRRADQLAHACRTFLNTKEPKVRGAGSVLISMTVDDIENMTLDSRFPTAGGDLLDPLALLRLGAADSDFVVLHDDRGQSLDVGRARRTANFYQRIALLASELVCTRPGCDNHGDECDVHHLVPWSMGGNTDIENLTILCPTHHALNRDERDGAGGLGHSERDPATGRAGFRAAGADELRFNDTVAQNRSAGAKIRGRKEAPPETGAPPGAGTADPPGPEPPGSPSPPIHGPDDPGLFDVPA
ncbi:hypothetical protein A605_01265 [Corynebacterium halotolerans YIM 70093 = DSM 44683]|uniref:HNH nuclease domain-containing protein n=2 Tax=Corynebacterium halotolerans TaxID=225326 RepID=M1NP34_9CORY|nr:hypothetical protein A605_01265 [Corynebacterium halotolerans YIM 70093 = DSM 44683]